MWRKPTEDGMGLGKRDHITLPGVAGFLLPHGSDWISSLWFYLKVHVLVMVCMYTNSWLWHVLFFALVTLPYVYLQFPVLLEHMCLGLVCMVIFFLLFFLFCVYDDQYYCSLVYDVVSELWRNCLKVDMHCMHLFLPVSLCVVFWVLV